MATRIAVIRVDQKNTEVVVAAVWSDNAALQTATKLASGETGTEYYWRPFRKSDELVALDAELARREARAAAKKAYRARPERIAAKAARRAAKRAEREAAKAREIAQFI